VCVCVCVCRGWICACFYEQSPAVFASDPLLTSAAHGHLRCLLLFISIAALALGRRADGTAKSAIFLLLAGILWGLS
jgi:hypothetical protein